MGAQTFNPALNQHVQQQPLMKYQNLNQPASELNTEYHNPSPSSNNASGISENATASVIRTTSEVIPYLNTTIPPSMLYRTPATTIEVSDGMSGVLHTLDGGNSGSEASRLAIDKEESIVSPENVRDGAHARKSEPWLTCRAGELGTSWSSHSFSAPNLSNCLQGLDHGYQYAQILA